MVRPERFEFFGFADLFLIHTNRTAPMPRYANADAPCYANADAL